MMADKQYIYLLALMPPDDVAKNIIAIQKEFGFNYQSVAALKVPPHITVIPPFKCEESFQGTMSGQFDNLAKKHPTFEVYLRGFGHFRNHTIFIKPFDSPSGMMSDLFESFYGFIKEELSFVKELKRFSEYNAHITVAYRDLSEEAFKRAWPEFENRKFESSFKADRLFLLKHIKGRWEVIDSFEFSESNELTLF